MTVTALMPVKTYHPRYLTEALDSLFGQTIRDWRLLVIYEPGDRDALARFLEPYLRDPRVSLIANEGRKLAGAFNTGMRHAETDFVAILLADDKWAANAVEVLTEQISAHPHVDFFHSSRMIIGDEGEPLSSVRRSTEDVSLEDFVLSSPVRHLLCWRREKALSFGGMDETLNSVGPDDFDFPWSMAEHGAAFQAIPDCLYIYRDHRACFRLTTHLPLSVHKHEIRRIMKKHRVDRVTIERRVLRARLTYLRQCLYRSRLDRWLKERVGLPTFRRWRETYR